ncbi:MAG: two component transcriptional regulator, LytTR family [Mucilaginibacter sp.]|jgi:DNA-binding LytR/AlgR family response regulator|nr:two component transcriptional regulator, LytTR family [Mucilaginibacter sp.]
MQNLKVIVIDDEPLAINLISDYVNKTPGLELLTSFSNPLEALEFLSENSLHLIFLDIHMPELSGLQIMKVIQNQCKVVVISAFPEYALEGYNHNVIDYLLKPVTMERFLQAVKKVKEKYHFEQLLNNVSHNTKDVDNDCIFVKTDSKILKVNIADILLIEGAGDYIIIYHGKERSVTSQTMKSMQDLLPGNKFHRVHKSFIVALNKISHIERDRISIGGKSVPISETYKDSFLQKIHSPT